MTTETTDRNVPSPAIDVDTIARELREAIAARAQRLGIDPRTIFEEHVRWGQRHADTLPPVARRGYARRWVERHRKAVANIFGQRCDRLRHPSIITGVRAE